MKNIEKHVPMHIHIDIYDNIAKHRHVVKINYSVIKN